MKPRTYFITALTARTQFGQVMERAGKGARFVVGKRGRPKVVILGMEDYAETAAPAAAKALQRAAGRRSGPLSTRAAQFR